MDLKLKGRTALVTGASKGIGLSVAQWFAREGVNVRMSARNGEAMDKAAAEMRASCKVDVKTYALDLSTDESPSFVNRFRRDYELILRRRPGITGYTQLAFAREGDQVIETDTAQDGLTQAA